MEKNNVKKKPKKSLKNWKRIQNQNDKIQKTIKKSNKKNHCNTTKKN